MHDLNDSIAIIDVAFHTAFRTLSRKSDRGAEADEVSSAADEASAVDAAEVWRALVDGRWFLVACEDRGGRRLLLLHPSVAEEVEKCALSHRDQRIVRSAVSGESSKLIAYEVGVSEGTVSTVLSAVANRLGAK